jgi:hypothetical protein
MAKVHYYHTGPFPIEFGFTTDEVAFRRECKKLRPDEDVPFPDLGATYFFPSDNRSPDYVIVALRVPKDLTPRRAAAILAHEAVHVWGRVLDTIEAKDYDRRPNEFQAYSVQYFLQCMLCSLAEMTKIKV